MAAAEAGLIDPTKTGKYPVILGDALLGNTSNEIFTDNHKPALSSNSAPNLARLKPSVPGKTASYDLSYADNNEKYAFAGTRNTESGQYVLYFDPSREAFVLDLVDSTFNMNVTRLPGNTDPDSLRRLYPHIDSNPQSAPKTKGKTENGAANADKPAPKARAKPTTQKKEVKRRPEKKQAPKNIALSLPVPMPAQPSKPAEPKKSTPAPEEEEEDDDDDGGLLVEYPGADTSTTRRTDFSPAFPSVRRFDEFMDQRESEGDDADGEEDDDPDMDFKLPSPANNRGQQYEPAPDPMDVDGGEEEEDEAEPEVDLAKELEDAFENFENGQESPDGDESEISEED
ncbi:hypothetical protein F66182_598 [Fusarium sp. NRRL 66182]|nr:hypothetical protein F66182_598 [Fusarium sp. NRRL 66182]